MSKELAVIGEGAVLAQYGPMRLTIQAWADGGPSTDLARRAGEFSFTLLPRLLPAREAFRRGLKSFSALKADFDEPMLNKMVLAAQSTGLPDLGPMAAVAGTVAETVNLFLKEAGAEKSIVENGGDLSLYLKPGQSARVGVRLGLDEPEPTRRLELSGDKQSLWGVCSSGFGGRSLTQGIADTAVCVAASSPAADAAATAVANHCRLDSPPRRGNAPPQFSGGLDLSAGNELDSPLTAKVKMVPAETLDPETDIKGLLVTQSVGELTAAEIDEALNRALEYAQKLADKKVILGAAVALRGKVLTTRGFETAVAPLDLR